MKIDTNILIATLPVTATVAFIQEAHKGQKYGNMPYFFHPVEVAAEAAFLANSIFNEDFEMVQAVTLAALLHDVIEDTDYTEADLRERYSTNVVDAVVLLSLNENLEYLENIQRIVDSKNTIAMIVKLADNRVNRGGDKSKFKPEKAERLNARYDASMALLTKAFKDAGIRVI